MGAGAVLLGQLHRARRRCAKVAQWLDSLHILKPHDQLCGIAKGRGRLGPTDLLRLSDIATLQKTRMASSFPDKLPLIRLPEPYKTTYRLQVVSVQHGVRKLQLRRSPRLDDCMPPPEPLHRDSLHFTDLREPDPFTTPHEANNSAWARAQRSPVTYWIWEGKEPPSVGQIWNVVHALFTLRTEFEIFRAVLSGKGKELLAKELQAVGLATTHPAPSAPAGHFIPPNAGTPDQLVIYRSTFWQGAGSPFGSRPVWVSDAEIYNSLRRPLTSFPVHPVQHTWTTELSNVSVHALHPIRPRKPTPGSRIYSRYIPQLDEFFSLWALDYRNDEHLQLFHTWQNEPRVAKGWHVTGTLEEHREYLRKAEEDPHQIAVLAKFNDTFFSYHQIYWAKVLLPLCINARYSNPPRRKIA